MTKIVSFTSKSKALIETNAIFSFETMFTSIFELRCAMQGKTNGDEGGKGYVDSAKQNFCPKVVDKWRKMENLKNLYALRMYMLSSNHLSLCNPF